MSDKTIHIVMIGARRTGKSSVLSSMIGSFRTIAQGTNFRLEADKNTKAFIDSKLIDLRKVFNKYWGKDHFLIDESPTPNPDSYVFRVSYQGEKKEQEIAELVFHDIAGEDIGNKETAELVKKACVLLIAVDTVHLMEENGKFSSVFHKSMQLKNIVATAGFAADDGEKEPKMVLFVPLKCEKYYEEGCMDEVTRRVQVEFQSLIEYLKKSDFPKRITVAITPILTMGSIAFDHFGRDEDGMVVRQRVKGSQADLRPAQVYYRFIGDKIFRAQYCEQPVLYILSFVIASAKKEKMAQEDMKKKENIIWDVVKLVLIYRFLGVIYLGLWLLLSNKAFISEYEQISVKLKKTKDGYKMLQNPLGL